MAITQVNPHSIETRYTLGLMAYHLSLSRPTRVRIASCSTEMAKAALRSLCSDRWSFVVESPEIKAAVADTLGLTVEVAEPGSKPADAALFPFSIEEGAVPAGEQTIVVACRNSLSYKSIAYPRSIRGTASERLAALRKDYRLRPVAGLYSPNFILLLSLAKIAERFDSSWYFRLEDRAMARLITQGFMWRFSYIVVAAGQNSN